MAERSGEVMFRGNIVMKGYLKILSRPSRLCGTAGSTPAIWASSIQNGCIQLKDRSKDIIISGGENISSIESGRHAATSILPSCLPRWSPSQTRKMGRNALRLRREKGRP